MAGNRLPFSVRYAACKPVCRQPAALPSFYFFYFYYHFQTMKFISTRGQSEPVSFTEAVATGLAPDGGLYLPAELPNLADKLSGWAGLSYPELCVEFLKLFATDMEPATLERIVKNSYKTFTDPQIAPLVELDDHTYVLELFHGPTLAFKDFALQLLGNLYEEQIARTGEPINVLGATSGDTGSAAIYGLLGKKGVRIFILYPEGRVSPLQERQMTTTGATNVYPICINGSFDDAQALVKDAFGNAELKARHRLSAINSINLARILAQCVYYVWAYLRLPEQARERPLRFVVPTGNFGNVLAGWLAKQMGLPIDTFGVATNQNDILYRLFTSGEYKLGPVLPSLAPSMDIQIASNFERYLYYFLGCDAAKVREVMAQFKNEGLCAFEGFVSDDIVASRATDSDIKRLIARVHKDYGYVADPHTACGFAQDAPEETRVILSTAHPAKFPETIADLLGEEPKADALEAIKEIPIVNYPLPATAEALEAFLNQHAGKHSRNGNGGGDND